VVHQGEGLQFLPPVPRPPLLRDFMGFETHQRNIYPKLGREIPPEWYKIPVYYKGNAGSLGTHGDDIAIPSYATALDIEFELAMVVGRGGINIPADSTVNERSLTAVKSPYSLRSPNTLIIRRASWVNRPRRAHIT
jgi:2-keto-4-pentenoate hydratase/2-oxohepta-3-ene-1,7-dioic acid hydratase in catechol pathway